MKKLLPLSLALTLALSVPALAVERPEGWTPADGARLPEGPMVIAPAPEVVDVPVSETFAGVITVDGEEVDLSNVPGAPAGYIPMRAVCEAAGGVVDWFAEDGQALFFLDEQSFIVNFSDLSISCDSDQAGSLTAYLDPAGYTFLPASLLNGLGKITVDDHPELDSIRYDIVTSASDPMTKVSNSILEACEMPRLTTTMPEMLDVLGFDMDNYTQLVARSPMMNVQSATLFIAQVADGKLDAAKKDFQAFQDQQIASFEHYLQGPYEMAKAGQIVVSPDGQHLMLVISEHNDKAIELFNAAYPAQ